MGFANLLAAVPDIGDKQARELAIAVTAYAQGEKDEKERWTYGRYDGLRPCVHGCMAVGSDACRAVVGGELPSLADRLWASEEVMSLNAELGLTMDQLARLARAILGPNVLLTGGQRP